MKDSGVSDSSYLYSLADKMAQHLVESFHFYTRISVVTSESGACGVVCNAFIRIGCIL